MKHERISMELIRQEPLESDVAFMTRVMLKLEEIQSRPDTRMIMPLPTENITGQLTYHLTIMSSKPETPARTDDNFHCGDECDGDERCNKQCRECNGDKIK